MARELTPDEHAALKARQSKIGRSNVRRSKSHERRCAHLLTDWAGVEFRRRRVEGRDSTVIDRESTADVIPVRGDIIFSIEAKCGEVTSLDGLLANPINNQFTKWWHQACYDAQLASKAFSRKIYPMLFFKPHPNHDWVAVAQEPFIQNLLKPRNCDNGTCLPEVGVEQVGSSLRVSTNPVWFPHLEFDAYRYLGEIAHNVKHTKKKENQQLVHLQLEPLFMCRWRDFARHVEPQSIFVVSSPLPVQS